MMKKPNAHLGLRHIALFVTNLTECVDFYVNLLGFTIVWQPDEDNVYLSSGTDNLALHRAPKDFIADNFQRLDHLGFFLSDKAHVDEWHDFLKANHVEIKA